MGADTHVAGARGPRRLLATRGARREGGDGREERATERHLALAGGLPHRRRGVTPSRCRRRRLERRRRGERGGVARTRSPAAESRPSAGVVLGERSSSALYGRRR